MDLLVTQPELQASAPATVQALLGLGSTGPSWHCRASVSSARRSGRHAPRRVASGRCLLAALRNPWGPGDQRPLAENTDVASRGTAGAAPGLALPCIVLALSPKCHHKIGTMQAGSALLFPCCSSAGDRDSGLGTKGQAQGPLCTSSRGKVGHSCLPRHRERIPLTSQWSTGSESHEEGKIMPNPPPLHALPQ